MNFTSVTFLLFISAVFLLYFVTPRKNQYITLLLASYVFYYIVSKGVMAYILITTVSVFFGGHMLKACNDRIREALGNASLDKPARNKLKQAQMIRKKWILISALLINFGILAVLKYNRLLLPALELVLPDPALQRIDFASLALPIGISFYTFQSIGYLIDVYRGKYGPEKNILKFALFISFFPQIMQGPIARYDDLAHQLYEPHTFDFDRTKNGILLIGWGFIKKMIVADRLAVIVATVFQSNADYSGSLLFTAAFTYGLQVYCDFSAGMDIAHGVAEIMGIRMAKNFLQPYFANSIADFWRRWHVTLGTWMRDYLFYPLSLSSAFGRLGKAVRRRRGSRWSKIIVSGIVSFIVFTVVGIWHGAETKYILYGFWNGALIMLAILLEPLFAKGLSALHIRQQDLGWRIFRVVRTLFLLSIGRSIVCSQSGSVAFANIRTMIVHFAPADLVNGQLGALGLTGFDFGVVLILLAVVFLIDYLHEKGVHVRAAIAGKPIVFRWAVYFLMIFALLMLIPTGGNVSGGFIYAQF